MGLLDTLKNTMSPVRSKLDAALDATREIIRKNIQRITDQTRGKIKELENHKEKTKQKPLNNLIKEFSQAEKTQLLKYLDSVVSNSPDKRIYEGSLSIQEIKQSKQKIESISKQNGVTVTQLTNDLYKKLKKNTGSGQLNLLSQTGTLENLELRAQSIANQLLEKDPEITNQAILKLKQSLDANYITSIPKADYVKILATGDVGGVNLKENPTKLVLDHLIKPLDKEPLDISKKDELKKLILEELGKKTGMEVKITKKQAVKKTSTPVKLDSWLDEADQEIKDNAKNARSQGKQPEKIVTDAERAERTSDYAIQEINRINAQIKESEKIGDKKSVAIMTRNRKTYENMLTSRGREKLSNQQKTVSKKPVKNTSEEISGMLRGKIAVETSSQVTGVENLQNQNVHLENLNPEQKEMLRKQLRGMINSLDKAEKEHQSDKVVGSLGGELGVEGMLSGETGSWVETPMEKSFVGQENENSFMKMENTRKSFMDQSEEIAGQLGPRENKNPLEAFKQMIGKEMIYSTLKGAEIKVKVLELNMNAIKPSLIVKPEKGSQFAINAENAHRLKPIKTNETADHPNGVVQENLEEVNSRMKDLNESMKKLRAQARNPGSPEDQEDLVLNAGRQITYLTQQWKIKELNLSPKMVDDIHKMSQEFISITATIKNLAPDIKQALVNMSKRLNLKKKKSDKGFSVAA